MRPGRGFPYPAPLTPLSDLLWRRRGTIPSRPEIGFATGSEATGPEPSRIGMGCFPPGDALEKNREPYLSLAGRNLSGGSFQASRRKARARAAGPPQGSRRRRRVSLMLFIFRGQFLAIFFSFYLLRIYTHNIGEIVPGNRHMMH